MTDDPTYQANGGAPPLVIMAVDPGAPGMSRIADQLDAAAFLPGRRAFYYAIVAAKRMAMDEGGRPIVAVLASNQPSLVGIAAADPAVTRIAIYHSAHLPMSRLKRIAARALFALVDLTIVGDDESEDSAIMLGADPDRVARLGDPIVDRLMVEPRRRDLGAVGVEAAASVALDAAELTGLVRLAELVAPDKGVNVVNYHRILPIDEIRTYGRPQMALAAPVFDAQLAAIAGQRGFTQIAAVRERDAAGRVAITFDDGYEDNYRVALPILKRHGTPACIFIVTDLVGRPEALWWDRVGRALFAYWLATDRPPMPEALPEKARALSDAASLQDARSIIADILGDLNEVDDATRAAVVAAAETLVADIDSSRTMLSWEEVDSMRRSGVQFGSHTKHHVCMDQVSPEIAAEELFGSQAELEAKLDHAPEALKITALPRGKLGPFREDELRAAGFIGVMTTEAGVNRADDRSLFVQRRDGKMLTLKGRHHPAKLRLELTGLVDRLRNRRD